MTFHWSPFFYVPEFRLFSPDTYFRPAGYGAFLFLASLFANNTVFFLAFSRDPARVNSLYSQFFFPFPNRLIKNMVLDGSALY